MTKTSAKLKETRIDRNDRAKVVIVDDHPLIRERLTDIFNREPDLFVCGEASTREEALQVVLAEKPDLVILDLTLPDAHGVDLIKDLQKQAKQVKVLVLSMHDESLFGRRAILAGARGYIHKREASDHVLKAVRQVLEGGLYISDELSREMASSMAGKGKTRTGDPVELLSDRELAVLERIGTGLSTREIAKLMCLNVKTIETYRERIMSKLDLPDASSLRRAAIHWSAGQKPS